MNTVLKGETFETNSYELIRKAIENDEFGISPKYSRVFLKKGYYSSIRKKEIIFDLSIELWPPKADRYSILYLIECKDYSTKGVPVGDIENFLYKIRQINNSHGNDAKGVKGVFISNSSFQEGAIEIAKETGLMLIEIDSNSDLSIKLHRASRSSNVDQPSEETKVVETFLFNVFELTKVQGLRKYSKGDIQKITNNLIKSIDENILPNALATPLDKIIEHLKQKHNLKFDFEGNIDQTANKQIIGFFDVKNNLIKIDRLVLGTDRFSFLLSHEIGHFMLHRELKINQQVYDNFQDSEYDFLENKYLLSNYKNWIEWQANEFASNLIMPDISFMYRLIYIQTKLGISRVGYIYLDDQPINRTDFGEITTYLAKFFNTTYTSVVYKLESLALIIYSRRRDNYKDEIRNLFRTLKTEK